MSDHSSDSDNNNNVPVPTELDLTLLSSFDDSSTSSDGLSNSLISQPNIHNHNNLDMSLSRVNKDNDVGSSSSEDGDFVTTVYKTNLKCQYPLFYEKIMSEELNTKAHKAHMKKKSGLLNLLNKRLFTSLRNILI